MQPLRPPEAPGLEAMGDGMEMPQPLEQLILVVAAVGVVIQTHLRVKMEVLALSLFVMQIITMTHQQQLDRLHLQLLAGIKFTNGLVVAQ